MCTYTYADYTELYLSGHDLFSVQHDFQCDLDAIQVWLRVNQLQLNVSKSVVMLIGTRQKTSHRNVSVYILMIRCLLRYLTLST